MVMFLAGGIYKQVGARNKERCLWYCCGWPRPDLMGVERDGIRCSNTTSSSRKSKSEIIWITSKCCLLVKPYAPFWKSFYVVNKIGVNVKFFVWNQRCVGYVWIILWLGFFVNYVWCTWQPCGKPINCPKTSSSSWVMSKVNKRELNNFNLYLIIAIASTANKKQQGLPKILEKCLHYPRTVYKHQFVCLYIKVLHMLSLTIHVIQRLVCLLQTHVHI